MNEKKSALLNVKMKKENKMKTKIDNETKLKG